MSHTPGPWTWDKHGDLRGRYRNAIINPCLRGDVLSGVNREADALLIAAAPDLLKALESIADIEVDGLRERQRVTFFKDIARAAIAKAKGES